VAGFGAAGAGLATRQQDLRRVPPASAAPKALGELNHRVKNRLATVHAIAQQTLRQTDDPTAFAASFWGRLQALSRAHSVLSEATSPSLSRANCWQRRKPCCERRAWFDA
jgi:two-component sensor histidine kinase